MVAFEARESKLRQTKLYLTPQLASQLVSQAKREGISKSELMRRALLNELIRLGNESA